LKTVTGFLEVLLGEPALVFGLEVEAVFDRIFEGLPRRLLEERDRLGVGNALERPAGDEFEPLAQALVHELLEDRDRPRGVPAFR
jgi:hypothetical protein